MPYPGIAWPPVVGTHVWVKVSGLLGKVIAVEGPAHHQRFIVAVLTPVPSRWSCELGDLDPVHWPSARPTEGRS